MVLQGLDLCCFSDPGGRGDGPPYGFTGNATVLFLFALPPLLALPYARHHCNFSPRQRDNWPRSLPSLNFNPNPLPQMASSFVEALWQIPAGGDIKIVKSYRQNRNCHISKQIRPSPRATVASGFVWSNAGFPHFQSDSFGHC